MASDNAQVDDFLAANERANRAESGRGSKMVTLLVTCLISTVCSVFVILLLASDAGLNVPFNPLIALRTTTNNRTAPTPTSSTAPMAQTDKTVKAELEAENELAPLREALKDKTRTVERVNALIAFNTILGQYAQKSGGYPNSNGKIVPLQSALDIINYPDFNAHVAREIFDDMRYISDGTSYKVIIIGSGDCAVARVLRPSMVDPQRSSGALDCLAYGFWSPKGANF